MGTRVDPVTAAQISDLPRIVAFRNVLVHGYAVIDDALVFEVATFAATQPCGHTRSTAAAQQSGEDTSREHHTRGSSQQSMAGRTVNGRSNFRLSVVARRIGSWMN